MALPLGIKKSESKVARLIDKARVIEHEPTAEIVVPAFQHGEIILDSSPTVKDWRPQAHLRFRKIYIRILLISPGMATEMLQNNIGTNRRVSDRDVTSYAEQMENDQWWWQAGSPIRFSDKGELLDGQHRLKAIVESGTTQPVIVIYNVPTDAMRGIDAGKRRTIAQQITMQGRDTKDDEVTIAKIMMSKWGSVTKSVFAPSDIEKFIKDFDASIKFAIEQLPQYGTDSVKKLISGSVRAPVAKAHALAHYGDNNRTISKLKKFCHQLMTVGKMIQDRGDISLSAHQLEKAEISDQVLQLAVFLLARGKRADSHKIEKYRKAMWVLFAFMEDRTFERVNEAAEDLFALDGLFTATEKS